MFSNNAPNGIGLVSRWYLRHYRNIASGVQVLSKTLDSTALTPEKVELATLVHDDETNAVRPNLAAKSIHILATAANLYD